MADGAPALSVSGSAVVAEAERFLGYPYAYTGASPATGFSCIGLVSYVYHQLGVNMAGDLGGAMAQYPQVSESALEPGDIVFFQNTWWPGVSHVAIYIGNGQVIHAENPSRGVVISSISGDPSEGDYWQQHYLTAERPWSAVQVTSPPVIRQPVTRQPVAQQPITRQPVRRAPVVRAPVRRGTARSLAARSTLRATARVPSPGSPAAAPRFRRQVRVLVPSLNYRSSPSLSAGIITVVSQGTTLGVLGRTGAWLHVQLSNGTSGWVVWAGVHRNNGPVGTTALAAKPATSARAASRPASRITRRASHVGRVHTPRRIATTRKVVHAVSWKQTTTSRVNGLRVHASPSLNAPVLTTLASGQRVGVLGNSAGWLKVGVGANVVGWVDSRYAGSAPTARVARVHAAIRPRTSSAAKRVVGNTPLAAGINLHAAPSLGAAVIATTNGEPIRVLSRSGGWDKVELSNGVIGSVLSRFIAGVAPTRRTASKQTATTSPQPASQRSAATRLHGGVSVVAGVRIHSAPSLSAPALGATTTGMKVQVLGYSSDLAHVRTSAGTVGWMATQFVGGSASAAPKATNATAQTTASGPHVIATVNVHTTDSVQAPITGIAPMGAKVTVLGSVVGWYLIQTPGGARGYVSAQYVAN